MNNFRSFKTQTFIPSFLACLLFWKVLNFCLTEWALKGRVLNVSFAFYWRFFSLKSLWNKDKEKQKKVKSSIEKGGAKCRILQGEKKIQLSIPGKRLLLGSSWVCRNFCAFYTRFPVLCAKLFNDPFWQNFLVDIKFRQNCFGNYLKLFISRNFKPVSFADL